MDVDGCDGSILGIGLGLGFGRPFLSPSPSPTSTCQGGLHGQIRASCCVTSWHYIRHVIGRLSVCAWHGLFGADVRGLAGSYGYG